MSHVRLIAEVVAIFYDANMKSGVKSSSLTFKRLFFGRNYMVKIQRKHIIRGVTISIDGATIGMLEEWLGEFEAHGQQRIELFENKL